MLIEDEASGTQLIQELITEGQRIRYYGFLANRYPAQKLARCRHLFAMPQPLPPDDQAQKLTGTYLTECPACQRGRMVIIEVLKPAKPN